MKNLSKRTVADKVLHYKAFNIANNPKYHGHERVIASMVYNFLDKKVQVVLLNFFLQNQESDKELHKPIIRKFEKRNVHSSFIDNIWSADLADMHDLADSFKR